MDRRALLALGLVGKLLACGVDGPPTQRETGPDEFAYCYERVTAELRERLESRRDEPTAYCELYALEAMDGVEACLDNFGPYIHVCTNIDGMGKELDYEATVRTCVNNLDRGENNKFSGLTARCVAYHIEEE